MAVSFAKMAPTAVVVSVVGYCVWPYVFPAAPAEATKPAKLPEIAASMLRPKVLAPPERDPFQTVAESRAPAVLELAKNLVTKSAGGAVKDHVASDSPKANGAKQNSEPGRVAPVASGATRPGSERPFGDSERTLGMDRLRVNKAPSAAAVLTGTKAALPALALQATCLVGDKGLAVINGQICRLGEKLPASGKTGPEVVLAQVFADRVLLESDGRTIELKYPDTPNPATQSKSAAPAAKASSSAARAKKPATRSSPAAHGPSKSAK